VEPRHDQRSRAYAARLGLVMDEFRVVFVTVPDAATGRMLTEKLLDARAVACVNILPQVESHYWWQGKKEQTEEWLMVCKTTVSHWEKLRAIVAENHPYECPEIIAIPIAEGHSPYLGWIARETEARG